MTLRFSEMLLLSFMFDDNVAAVVVVVAVVAASSPPARLRATERRPAAPYATVILEQCNNKQPMSLDTWQFCSFLMT